MRHANVLAGGAVSYPPKLNSALAKLAAAGIRPGNYAPPLHRLLWRAGLILPPPHLASFGFNFIFSAAWFGVGWGALMWFMLWSRDGTPGFAAAGMALLAGALFGLGMAAYYRRGARRFHLPPWSDIEPGQ
jgi:hypothetical protein